jgi:hypothetical protein
MKSWYKTAQEYQDDYRGQHSAPVAEQGASMDNPSDIYPDDIYGSDAVRMYGDGVTYDMQSIGIIQGSKGRPHRSVKIYRAVPDYNYDVNKQILGLNKLLNYRTQYGFFPMSDKTIEEIEGRFPFDQYGYEGQQEQVVNDIESQIETLRTQLNPRLKIENGDWVTISREYAKEHGDSQLQGKYKILTKTVRAGNLFTTGDSIHEWGYWA